MTKDLVGFLKVKRSELKGVRKVTVSSSRTKVMVSGEFIHGISSTEKGVEILSAWPAMKSDKLDGFDVGYQIHARENSIVTDFDITFELKGE